jgi:hypothetical protein
MGFFFSVCDPPPLARHVQKNAIKKKNRSVVFCPACFFLTSFLVLQCVIQHSSALCAFVVF